MSLSCEERDLNRCDVCGKFIAMRDFEHGAVRQLIQCDDNFRNEIWEVLCKKHANE